MAEPKVLIVTGATGHQGSAVIDALIAADDANFHILAVTRNTTSAAANALRAKSKKISVIEGNLDDATALLNAVQAATNPQTIWGVFSMQQSGNSQAAAVMEEKQGQALVDASLAAGVQHFVYASVDRNGEQPTDIPYFASKHRLEKYLIESAKDKPMKWTILRPVSFMENFDGSTGKAYAAMLRVSLKAKPIQFVATHDVGVVAARAFCDPDSFSGKTISIAGDELTFDALAAVYRDKVGRDVPALPGFVGRLILLSSKDLRVMFNFFAEQGYGADVTTVKAEYPGIMNFGTWLEWKASKSRK
ncbi:hypothetical protein VHEMI10382 [[Torrubiella] hemipterigena]|uniref:NmrA-like domain-containing protein n=1 Tax=[Torrubiella] hemipterigena TaxID=1531966 RepID=A0A0A1TRR5_9HYPO|nr:hypothetical protein VHEMI10382 [[Torrubiella] hemipterigena]